MAKNPTPDGNVPVSRAPEPPAPSPEEDEPQPVTPPARRKAPDFPAIGQRAMFELPESSQREGKPKTTIGVILTIHKEAYKSMGQDIVYARLQGPDAEGTTCIFHIDVKKLTPVK